VFNGVPFDTAFKLDTRFSAAFAILFSEFSGGGRFNYDRWAFEKPS